MSRIRMLVKVKVFPKSRKNDVVREGEILKVYVSAPAEDGKANDAALQALANFLGVKKSRVRIVRGLKSRNKTVEVIA